MALSINPIEIVKIFSERGIRNREAIVGYLLSIATVATDLVNCWIKLLESRLMTDEAAWENKRLDRDLMMARNTQTALFFEASEYYKRASSVLGGRLSKAEMDDLFNALGSLLHIREETKALFNMPNAHCPEDEAFVHTRIIEAVMGQETWPDLPVGNPGRIRPPDDRPEQLQRMIDEMQREAATLRALAAAIRAQP
jgi:hypothetical protein